MKGKCEGFLKEGLEIFSSKQETKKFTAKTQKREGDLKFSVLNPESS
jgi:hypothetical protein